MVKKKTILIVGAIFLFILMNQGKKQAVIETVPIINGDFQIPEDCNLYLSLSGNCLAGWDTRPGVGAGGGPVGILDYDVYHAESPSLRIDPSTPMDTNECDRTVWQEPRTDVSAYLGQTFKLSAWVRHDACNNFCGISNEYSGTMLTNRDCCEYEGVCTNPLHYPGLWCAISDRGGVRLGIDFYEYDNYGVYGDGMFQEWSVTDDWITPDNEWHYMEFEGEIPLNWVNPTTGVSSTADQAIIWVQGYPCESDATFWMDDVKLEIVEGATSGYATPLEIYLSFDISSDYSYFFDGSGWDRLPVTADEGEILWNVEVRIRNDGDSGDVYAILKDTSSGASLGYGTVTLPMNPGESKYFTLLEDIYVGSSDLDYTIEVGHKEGASFVLDSSYSFIVDVDGISNCNNPADTTPDCSITFDETLTYAGKWINNQGVTFSQFISVAEIWVNGGNY